MVGGVLFAVLGALVSGEVEVLARLEAERRRLFSTTLQLKDSGYLSGPAGSSHEVFFPIGRGDRLYYVSFVAGKHGKVPKPSDYTMSIACWQRTEGESRRIWLVKFVPYGKRIPSGTLLRLAYSKGMSSEGALGKAKFDFSIARFVPVRTGKDWKLAREELTSNAPLAMYHYGQHGDIDSQFVAAIIGPDTASKLEHLKYMTGRPYGKFTATQAEVKLMRKRGMFPKKS